MYKFKSLTNPSTNIIQGRSAGFAIEAQGTPVFDQTECYGLSEQTPFVTDVTTNAVVKTGPHRFALEGTGSGVHQERYTFAGDETRVLSVEYALRHNLNDLSTSGQVLRVLVSDAEVRIAKLASGQYTVTFFTYSDPAVAMTLSLPDTLVFRFTRTPDDQLVPCLFHEGRWISGLTTPTAGISQTGAFSLTVRLAGTSTAPGNGEVTPIHLHTFPVFWHPHWYDGHPSTLPICLSMTDRAAVFMSDNLCYGEFTGALLYGCGAGLGDTAVIEDFTSLRPDRNGDELALVTSLTTQIYSDSNPPAVCPLRGLPSENNRGNTEAYNTCFDDGSPQDLTTATYEVRTAGSIQPEAALPGFSMRIDGARLGCNHVFQKNISLTSELLSPLRTAYSRTLALTNGDVLYYGVEGGAGVDDYDESAQHRLQFTIFVQPGGPGVPDMAHRLRVFRIGDDTPIYSQSFVTAPSSSETGNILLTMPRGHYYVEHEVTNYNAGRGADFECQIDYVDPVSSFEYPVAYVDKQSLADRADPGLTRLYFDYNYFAKGRFFAYLHDVSANSFVAIDVSGSEHLADLTTKSISAFEGASGLLHFCYLETNLDLRDSLRPVNQPIMVSTYDPETDVIQRGNELHLPSVAQGDQIWSFDACVLNNQLHVYYTVAQKRNNRYTRKALQVADRDIYGRSTNEYVDVPLAISSFPHLTRTLKIATLPLNEVALFANGLSRCYMSNAVDYAVSSLEVALQMREFWTFNEAELATVAYREFGYYAGAQEIKCQASSDHNSIVVSVIEQSRRLPFILAGSGKTLKEVCLPPFFDIAYNDINQMRPIESLEACWNIDGDIVALATTIQLENMQDFASQPDQPHAELMSLDTSILRSNRDRFFEFDMGSNWVGNWQLVNAYQPARRFEAVPVFNAHHDKALRTFTYSYNIVPEVTFNTYEDRPEMPARFMDNLSLTRDKHFLRVSASGSAYEEPAFYHSQFADSFPFGIPAHTVYHPSFLNTTPPLVESDLVTNGSTGATTINSSGFLIDALGVSKKLRLRNFEGNRGCRARFSFVLPSLSSSVDEDGMELVLHDNTSNPDGSGPTLESQLRARITKPTTADVYELRAQYMDAGTLAYVTFATTELLPGVLYDLDLACKQAAQGNSDYMLIVKPRLSETGAVYSQSYAPASLMFNASAKASLSDGDIELYYRISSFGGDMTMDVWEVQLGDLIFDNGPREPVDGAFVDYGANPFIGGSSMPRNDSPTFALQDGHARTQWMLAATSGNVSCELYYPQGFKTRFTGTSNLTGDSLTLTRSVVTSPNNMLSSKLHGFWRASSSSAVIWADAQDSGLSSFVFDTILLKGKNFKDYQVVVRDSDSDPWQVVATVNSSHTRYRALANLSFPNSRILEADMKIYPDHHAMLDRRSWVQSLDTLELLALDDEAMVCAPPTTQVINQILSPFTESIRLPTPTLALPVRYQDVPDAPGSSFDFDAQVYSSDHFHRLSEPLRARYAGIRVSSSTPLPGGAVELESFDLGYASDLIDTLPDNGRGFQYEYASDVQYVLNNQVSESNVKNVSKQYNLSYGVTKSSTAHKIEAILSKISLNAKPIWVIEDVNDPDSCRLCLCDGEATRELLVDKVEARAYSITLKLKAVE